MQAFYRSSACAERGLPECAPFASLQVVLRGHIAATVQDFSISCKDIASKYDLLQE